MAQKEKIEIIITGGTIDSFYDSKQDTVVPSEKSSLPDFISSLKLPHEFSFTQICMKDSRSINEEDRKNVLAAIENSTADKILVTHGTYTMPDTARFIDANLKRKDTVIIFTGSMIPLIGFSPSDAPFNLGYAIASLATLQPGVYVCMNGQAFTPAEVVKQLSEGKFGSIFNS
ncbi:MAG: asparaginase [Candidatus Pacebacteria bacterium]|jgi:L-asparaginase|nr:asparaginase [Candidatus Paceibacterota bacterium]